MFLSFTLICIGCNFFSYGNLCIFFSLLCVILRVLRTLIALIYIPIVIYGSFLSICVCGIVFVWIIIIANINDVYDRF